MSDIITKSDMFSMFSSDGTCIKVNKECSKLSTIIKIMMETNENEDENEDEDDNEIHLELIDTSTLEKIKLFFELYSHEAMIEIERPLRTLDTNIQKEYNDYIDVNLDALMKLMVASNYLDIQPLYDLSCAKIASLIKGKTPSEIKYFFNID
jgi:S-phase kinase-associated protein 1